MNYITQLEKMYAFKNILHAPLYQNCMHCTSCWHGAEHRKLSDKVDHEGLINTHLYKPWIGSAFETKRILVIAQNMNNYGGYEAQEKLIRWGKVQLAQGKKKLFKSPTYSGTLLYHRVGAYLISMLKKEGMSFSPFINGYPAGKEIAAVYEHVAMTNIIKCSLTDERSNPTGAMWENCGRHVLLEEMKILKPTSLLIIGKEVLKALNGTVFDTPLNINYSPSVISDIASINGLATRFINVIHPAAFGGSSHKLVKGVYDLS